MPRNASGIYVLPPGTAAVDTAIATAAQFNGRTDDLAADLNVVRPIVAGGTGASSASAARASLGLDIGVNVQAYDAGLASIAGLTTAADTMIYATASDTYATTPLTAAGRALIDDATATAQRTTLGLGTAAVAALIDDDTMATATSTNVPSAESVKAYVASQQPDLSWAKSGQLGMSSAGTLSFAHGLGSQPDEAQFFLVCVSDDLGYSIGDRLRFYPMQDGTAVNNPGFQTYDDATNVYLLVSNAAVPLELLNKATGERGSATLSRWRAVIWAR